MNSRWYAAAAALTVMVTGLVILEPRPTPAYACSCAELTEREHAAHADLIVEGVVTQVRRPIVRFSSAARVGVTIVVERVHHGQADEWVDLTTVVDEASCGFTFERGQRYLVYARGGQTGLCSGNQHLGAASAVPRGPDRTTGAAVVGAALVVAAGMAWWSVRRGRPPATPAGRG